MKIGFLVAMEDEYEPFLSFLGKHECSAKVSGIDFELYTSGDNTIVLGKCGIGEIASAAATSLLIGYFDCEYVVNFGLVGSLNGRELGSLVCVKDVVHYDCDVTAFGYALGQPAGSKEVYFKTDAEVRGTLLSHLPAVRLASGDKFISKTEIKNRLVAKFSADICDMEGAGVAITCSRAGVPFTMIKLVSDGADESAAETFRANKSNAFGSAVTLVLSLLQR